jgi:hypothetical protein
MTNLEIKKKSKIEIVELASALGTPDYGHQREPCE